MTNDELDDLDDVLMDEYCPNCHADYDEIDYDYQICHLCKYVNKQEGGGG